MNKRRIVLVGCGGMSGAWLRAIEKIGRLELVGLVDLDIGVARARAGEFGLADRYIGDSLEAALKQLHPDAVFDVTVPKAHKEVALTAFRNGCHLLGEKPMAESMVDAREMVEAAREAGTVYAVIQNYRYNRSIRTVEKVLRSGSIGQVHTVNADFYMAPHFGGFREAMDHVLLLDMAIHSFDQARFLSGSDPLEVTCHEYNPPGSWYRHGASAMAVFRMTGDVVFNYRGSWCAQGFPTPFPSEWRIIGSEGTLRWDGEEDIRVEVAAGGEGFMRPSTSVPVEPAVWEDSRNGHEGLIREFIEALDSGSLPATHCGDNIRSLAMVHGAIESARTVRSVKLNF